MDVRTNNKTYKKKWIKTKQTFHTHRHVCLHINDRENIIFKSINIILSQETSLKSYFVAASLSTKIY